MWSVHTSPRAARRATQGLEPRPSRQGPTHSLPLTRVRLTLDSDPLLHLPTMYLLCTHLLTYLLTYSRARASRRPGGRAARGEHQRQAQALRLRVPGPRPPVQGGLRSDAGHGPRAGVSPDTS